MIACIKKAKASSKDAKAPEARQVEILGFFSKSEVGISPTKSSPGNSSCDLFGDDYISDPVKGCW